MKKTIAQQLNIKNFPFEINDKNGNNIYHENSYNFWFKREFNSDGNQIYFEDSDNYWEKSEFNTDGNRISFEDSNNYWWRKEFDSDGNVIHYKDSYNYWCKREYDSDSNVIYYKNSDGKIIDNRPKTVELTLDQIADKFKIDVKDLKIKK